MDICPRDKRGNPNMTTAMEFDINQTARYQTNKQAHAQINFDCGLFASDNVPFVTCGGAQRPQGQFKVQNTMCLELWF